MHLTDGQHHHYHTASGLFMGTNIITMAGMPWWKRKKEEEEKKKKKKGKADLRRVAYPCLKARKARCLRNTELRAMQRKLGWKLDGSGLKKKNK